MKVAILAGGLGTRLAEHTTQIPKPMVEIGDAPVLWHIMKIYEKFGHKDFVVALGYKGDVIKEYFVNYRWQATSFTVSLGTGDIRFHDESPEDWQVDLLETGLTSNTGWRVKLISEHVGDEPFMLTYGDGVADINIDRLVDFHLSHGKIATLTAVRRNARFGEVRFDGDKVARFQEKPWTGEGWINGGFFVFQPEIRDFIDYDCPLEREPLVRLAEAGELMAYRHDGFWQCMDTLKDVQTLEQLWQSDQAPWKTWR